MEDAAITRLSEISLKSNLNTTVCICGILKSAEVRPMKNGKDSLTLLLGDKDKEAEIKWFDIQKSYTEQLELGEVYAVTVSIKKYDKGKDGISLIIEGNYVVKLDLDKRGFVNWEDNTQWAYCEINRLLSLVETSVTGQIAVKLIRDNLKDITIYPAASSMHHNGLGGLAVHIAGVACGCEILANYYKKLYGDNFINFNLLLSGALLHDIGKLKELELDLTTNMTDYSTLGKLGTHIMYGISMIQETAIDLGYRNRREVYELIHLIGSHHTKKEYGSPIEPSCIEADILARMDDLDAVAYRRFKAYKDLENGTGIAEWKSGGLFVHYKALAEEKIPEI